MFGRCSKFQPHPYRGHCVNSACDKVIHLVRVNAKTMLPYTKEEHDAEVEARRQALMTHPTDWRTRKGIKLREED